MTRRGIVARMHSDSSLVSVTRRLDATVAALTTTLLARAYGGRPAARYLAAFGGASSAQQLVLRALYRGEEPPFRGADLLSYCRATCGAVLAAILASGIRDRTGPAGRLGCAVSLGGATALDWLDGPLARRLGPTRRGAALDIEADSWLTLWSAAAATAWGGQPRWCLLPPLLRYLDPLLAMHAGQLPAGGGPWWARVTGATQMALFLAALFPLPAQRRPLPTIASVVVSGAQAA
ncbi:MAG TPA: CDP-alcohol phosphatidyltransferase family protein, partial [Chloroflexota bacterium]|nr:CDP-alcohol phosphatidyltransferase family protein [Chloroflexota bacterium]